MKHNKKPKNKQLPTWEELQAKDKRPLTSHRMVILDSSNYEGEPNIVHVEQRKRPMTPNEAFPKQELMRRRDYLLGIDPVSGKAKESTTINVGGEGILSQIENVNTYGEISAEEIKKKLFDVMAYDDTPSEVLKSRGKRHTGVFFEENEPFKDDLHMAIGYSLWVQGQMLDTVAIPKDKLPTEKAANLVKSTKEEELRNLYTQAGIPEDRPDRLSRIAMIGYDRDYCRRLDTEYKRHYAINRLEDTRGHMIDYIITNPRTTLRNVEEIVDHIIKYNKS